MPRTYGQRTCPTCGTSVNANGAAWSAHERKHVKEGTLVMLYSPILEKKQAFRPEEVQPRLDGIKDPNCRWMKAEA